MSPGRPFIALLFSGVTNAVACDCATTPVDLRANASDVVFVGEIVRHEPLKSVDITVLEVFKGTTARQVSISTGLSECDYFLKPIEQKPGDLFLVLLTKRDGRSAVNRCLGTAPLNEAASDVAYFRGHLRK